MNSNSEAFRVISRDSDEVRTDYNDLAVDHKRIFEKQHIVNYITDYTAIQLLGDVTNKAILDVGCGSGRLTRKLQQMGAFKIVGVDKSAEQIKLAKDEQEKQNLVKVGGRPVEYFVDDIASTANVLKDDGSYDAIVQAFVLNLAGSYEELLRMCKYLYNKLKVGGVFIGLNISMTLDPKYFNKLWKYGIYLNRKENLKDGDAIQYIYKVDGSSESITFVDHYLSTSTYEKAFKNAGFDQLEWLPLQISPDMPDSQFYENYAVAMKAKKSF